MARKKNNADTPLDASLGVKRDAADDARALEDAPASIGESGDFDNPSGESATAAASNRITEAIAAELAPSMRQRLQGSQFQTPIVSKDPDDPSVKPTSRRAIASRMGIAPGKLPSGEGFASGTQTYPKWTADSSVTGNVIRDVRFRNVPSGTGGPQLTAYNPLPKGVEGPVLPITQVNPLDIKPENVEVFDPSETVMTGADRDKPTRAPVEDVVTRVAVERAGRDGRAIDTGPLKKAPITAGAQVSVRSKFDLTDKELKGGMPLAKTGFASDAGLQGPAAPVARGVNKIRPTGKIGREEIAGPGIDETTGGVALSAGRTYGPPVPSDVTRVTEGLARMRGVEPPEVRMDVSPRVMVSGQQFGVKRTPLPEGHPMMVKWRAQQAAGTAPEGMTVGEFAESRGNPTDPGYGSNIRTSIPLGGTTGRGGQSAIRARQESLVAGMGAVPMPVREQIERAEMFSEDVTSRAFDIYSGVGLEPRDPENLRRRGSNYIMPDEGAAAGGVFIPKDLRVGRGAVTEGAPAGVELPEEPTPSQRLAAMSGADIIGQAEAAGRSLETAPAGQTPPAQRPEVRGKISDVRRIQHEARVQGVPLNSMHLAALTVLPETTQSNIEELMKPDLIGKNVTGRIGVDAPAGAIPVRKIIKGGDEAARTAESVEAAEAMGPLEERQAEGSFVSQPGEAGRAARAARNVETVYRQSRQATNRAANRRVGGEAGPLQGPGGGTGQPVPRPAEERRRRRPNQ